MKTLAIDGKDILNIDERVADLLIRFSKSGPGNLTKNIEIETKEYFIGFDVTIKARFVIKD